MKNYLHSICLIFLTLVSYEINAQCTVDASASSYDILCGETISLSAIGEGITVFEEDFNSGAPVGWASTASGVVGQFCGVNSPDNSDYLWFGGSSPSPRFAETPALDLTPGGEIRFYMRYSGREGGADCEDPDAPDEGVHLQYSISGGPWTEIDYWDPNGGGDPFLINWNQHTRRIPNPANVNDVRLRWVQLGNTGDAITGYLDHWGIEDVNIVVNNPNANYTWAHTGVTLPTGNTPDVTPLTTTTYTVTYEDGVNTCTDNVTINVVKAQVTASVSRTEICPGDPIDFISVSELTSEIPLNCGYSTDLTCDPLADQSGEYQIGNGTSVNTSGNCNDTPFGTSNCDGGLSTQIIYRASEVNAAGFSGGKIKNIQFDIASVDAGYTKANNFKLWIACTNLNAFGNMVPSNQLTQVYTPKNVTFRPGWNTFDLDKAFEWDGTSNIILMICWNNPQGQGTRARTRDVLPGWNCIIQDGTNSAGGANFDCWDDTFFSTGQRRPNTRFGVCEPRDITIDFNWTSSPNDPTFGGLTDQNPSAAPTVSGSYTYTVTANADGFPAGCAVSQQVIVDVQDAPETPQPTYNTGLCERDNLVLSFGPTALPVGPSYEWRKEPAGAVIATNKNLTIPAATPANNGTYSVLVKSSAGCPSLKGTVNVTVNPAPTGTITSNTPRCDGFDAIFNLAPNSNDGNPMSFAWTGVNGWTSTVEDPTRNDPFPDMNGNHSVVITNNVTGCTSLAINHNFVQTDRPVALPFRVNPAKATYCIGEQITFETDVNGGGFLDPNWLNIYLGGPNGLIQTVNNQKGTITFNPITLASGDGGDYWLVAQEAANTCITDTAFITIVVVEPGSFTATNNGPICEGEDLQLDVTDGGAGVNYLWSGPNAFGSAVRNATRLGVTAADAGVYTVSVDNGVCTPFDVTTTVVIDSPRDPGTDNTVGICETESNFDLFSALGGTPEAAGSWTDDTPSGGLNVDKFDATGLGNNSYNFTYTLTTTNTCPDQSATVTVDVTHQPIAGVDNTVQICNNETALDLFALLGSTAEIGGVWSETHGAGTLTGNNWDATGVAAGDYDFDYTVAAATSDCPDAVATITVTVIEELDPGTSTTLNVCEDDATAHDLYAALGSPDVGTWTNVNGAFGFNNVAQTFQANAGDGPGTYQFDYTVSAPSCPTKTATVTVISHRLPVAGNDGAATTCNSETAFDLFSGLGGTPDLTNGSWNNDSGAGVLTGSDWDATGVAAGDYNFTYTVTDPTGNCADASAVATITVVDQPISGTAVALDACTDDAPFSLFDGLAGYDTPGQWYNSLGNPIPDTFNPGAYTGGTYNFTYTVAGVAPCVDASTVVTVLVEDKPFAGNDGSITVCETQTSADLFAELGGAPDNNGTWDDGGFPGSINTATGELNPSILAPGTYTYTYTVPATAHCTSDDAEIEVTVNPTPIAGDDVTISACNGDNTPIDLLAELTANSATTPDVTGSWYNVTNNAAVPSGTFNPDGKAAGNYVFEYTVAGSNPCADDVAELTITIENQPYAGNDGSSTICNLKTNHNLFTALFSSTNTSAGSWLDIDGTGALSGPQNKIFNASLVGNGTYTFGYKLDAVAPCVNDTAFIDVTVTGQPDAGQDAVIEICNDRIVDLFSELGGNPHSGGVWTDKADGSGAVVDPATFDANGISGDTYYFRYDLSADAPCQPDFSVVTIHVNAQPDPGTNGAIVVCDGDAPFSLFNQLGGSPTSGGNWTDSGNNPVPEAFNPATGVSGIYTYTPTIPNQCQVVSANVDVTVNSAPQVTAAEACEIDALNYRVTLDITGGDPGSYTVVGSYVKGANPPVAVNGTLVGNTFTSDLIPTKATYTFSVDDANGCGPTVVSKYIDCGCATKVGTMGSALVEACVGTAINGVYDNTNQVSDGNDGLNFILHDDNSDPLTFGTILDVNTTIPQFNFIPGTMKADSTYYISAVYGNVDGSGTVNLSDTCLQISNRTPIRFNSIPNVSMGPDQDLCFGDNRDLVFTFTGGTANYTVTYDDATTSSGLNNTNNKVNKAPGTTTTYTVTRVTDAKGCFLDVSESTTLTVIPLPDISMTGDITYCEGTNNPVLTFTDNIPGVGVSPYTITVNDPVSGSDLTFNTSDSTVVNLPATGPGTFVYTFKSVSDASSQACAVAPNTTVTVTVNPTPAVTISGDKTICFGDSETIAVDFTTGTAPFTVVYNDGVNPDVVDAGIINDPQVYTLAPTVNTVYTFKSVTDANGCVATLTSGNVVNFTVNQLPVLNDVTVDDIELCNDNSTNLLFDITGNGNFTVDYTINGAANQQVVDGNSKFGITPTAVAETSVASTYNYVVTKITDNASPYNCVSTQKDSVIVTVYPKPTGTISIAQSPICENTNAQLNFAFTGVDEFDYTFEEVKVGEGSQSAFNKGYRDSLLFIPTLGLTDFTYKLTNITSTVSATGFQCSSTMNDSVNLLVQLAPEVTIGGDSIMCQNDSREVLFNVTRTTWPVTIELGNDVDTDTITYNSVVDGVTKVLNPMQPTSYNVVSVKDNSPLGCVGTASGIFNLDVITLPTATMTAPSKICEGVSDFLTFDLKDGRGGYTVEYADAGQVNTLSYPGITNVTRQVSINPTIPTKYKLLSVTDMSGLNCNTTYNNEITVDVVPLPVANLKGNNTICQGDSTALDFYFTKGIAPFSVTYTDGNSQFTEDTIYGSRTIHVAPTDSTNYKIVSITDGSGAGCTGTFFTSNAYVKVKELPVPDFTIDINEECVPFTTTFTNNTDPDKVGEVIWNFGNQTKSTIIDSQVKNEYAIPGMYNATLTVITPGNTKCSATSAPQLITAHAVPEADFEFFPALPTIMDPHVTFYNQSKFGDIFTWKIDGVEMSNGENFSNIFPDDDERSYIVTLIAEADVPPACIDSTWRKVLVKGELFVNVPNTFTPNGDDINDSFIPIMAGYDTEGYLFEVYDRWGELVFSTTDHTKAWEGNYKGEKAPSDLYIWKLEVKSKYLVEKDKFMGQVRLMR